MANCSALSRCLFRTGFMWRGLPIRSISHDAGGFADRAFLRSAPDEDRVWQTAVLYRDAFSGQDLCGGVFRSGPSLTMLVDSRTERFYVPLRMRIAYGKLQCSIEMPFPDRIYVAGSSDPVPLSRCWWIRGPSVFTFRSG